MPQVINSFGDGWTDRRMDGLHTRMHAHTDTHTHTQTHTQTHTNTDLLEISNFKKPSMHLV